MVTNELHVAVFPALSVSVSVTVFSPTLVQSKLVLSMVILAIPDSSVELLSSSVAVMFASIIGSYYTLNGRLDAAESEITKLKYNEKEYTWKAQRALEAEVKEMTLEMRDFMKDLEYLQKDNSKRK